MQAGHRNKSLPYHSMEHCEVLALVSSTKDRPEYWLNQS